MSLHPNFAKMRKSHIPAATYTTTLREEGLMILRNRITAENFAEGGKLPNLYLYARDDSRTSMRRVSLAAGLLAKELCLAGHEVIYTTLAGFLREIRFAEMEREQRSYNPVLTKIGSGYIVIGDLLEYADVEQKYGYHAMQLAADYLITHAHEGGGLIIGATRIDPTDVHMLGSDFSALIVKRFESYCID